MLFADDLLLHKVIACSEDFQALQNDVNSLVEWISQHNLTLNVRKCKSLLISRKHSPLNSQAVLIGGQPLEKVRAYKYLGILINSDLSWSDHVANVCSNARRHLGLLYRRFYKDAEAATLRVLYITHIRPHLEYATPVWDPHLVRDSEVLESVQRFASKVCTKSWYDLSYQDRLRLLNLNSLKSRRHYLKLCYLYKVLNGLSYFPDSPLSLYSSHHNTRSHELTLHVPFSHSL